VHYLYSDKNILFEKLIHRVKILSFEVDVENKSWIVNYNECVVGLAVSNGNILQVIVNEPFCSVIYQPKQYELIKSDSGFGIKFVNTTLTFS